VRALRHFEAEGMQTIASSHPMELAPVRATWWLRHPSCATFYQVGSGGALAWSRHDITAGDFLLIAAAIVGVVVILALMGVLALLP
jgi:hypothetical protein